MFTIIYPEFGTMLVCSSWAREVSWLTTEDLCFYTSYFKKEIDEGRQETGIFSQYIRHLWVEMAPSRAGITNWFPQNQLKTLSQGHLPTSLTYGCCWLPLPSHILQNFFPRLYVPQRTTTQPRNDSGWDLLIPDSRPPLRHPLRPTCSTPDPYLSQSIYMLIPPKGWGT